MTASLWLFAALSAHVFTDQMLTEDERIFVVVLGKVYDVSASPHFYGPEGAYRGFANGDATRAFLSADFEADGTSDVSGLTPDECAGLADWQRLYEEKYEYVGLHRGRFYDEVGQPTEALAEWQACASPPVD